MKRYDPKVKIDIVRDVIKGVPIKDISELRNIPQSTIKGWVKSLGTRVKMQDYFDQQQKEWEIGEKIKEFIAIFACCVFLTWFIIVGAHFINLS